MNKRVVVTLSIVILVLAMVGFIIQALYYSTIVVTVEGNHNPVADHIYVNGIRAYPEAEEGKIYRVEVRPGDFTVQYFGPKAESFTAEGVASMQSNETVRIERKGSSAILGTTSVGDLPDTSFYGYQSDWALLESASQQTDQTYVFRFNYTTGRWEQVAVGVKIDPYAPQLEDAPEELIAALEVVAGD